MSKVDEFTPNKLQDRSRELDKHMWQFRMQIPQPQSSRLVSYWIPIK